MSDPKDAPPGEGPTRSFQVKLDGWLADLTQDLEAPPADPPPAVDSHDAHDAHDAASQPIKPEPPNPKKP